MKVSLKLSLKFSSASESFNETFNQTKQFHENFFKKMKVSHNFHIWNCHWNFQLWRKVSVKVSVKLSYAHWKFQWNFHQTFITRSPHYFFNQKKCLKKWEKCLFKKNSKKLIIIWHISIKFYHLKTTSKPWPNQTKFQNQGIPTIVSTHKTVKLWSSD